MVAKWHREEPREVRPFFQAQKAEDALQASAIRLYKHGDVSIETSFDLDEIDFQKLDLAVHPVLADPSNWMPAGLTSDDLEVVLVATHSFLKRSMIIERYTVGDGDPPDRWNIGSDVLSDFAGGRNLELSLALCLRSDRAPIPGAPFVGGHWVARKTFALRSRSAHTLFDLRTRTDEDWIAASLPAKTLYFVEYAGGIAEEPEEGGSVATVYIHLDAHNRLVSSPALGEAFQPMLAAEIVQSVLSDSYDDWKDLQAPHPNSPLTTLLKQLGKENAMKLEDLKSIVASPARAKALLQDRLSVVQSLR
ncbi:hypothetical protein [Mesorhizobium sp. M1273]|uniref:hypothetical protein n=1 Tax=Mesorhizobium sp. M1273 TaxID=2957075 RepID=UPI003337B610